MKVIILDTLLNQVSNRKIADQSLQRLYEEFNTLVDLERDGKETIIAYIKSNDGIKFKGDTQIPVFKYRLTDGDRIIYTYGKYLPYVNITEESLVLLEYANHDEQGRKAINHKYHDIEHDYYHLVTVLENIDDIIEGEKDIPADIWADIAASILTDCPKGIVLTSDELKTFTVNDIDKFVLLSEEQADILNNISKSNSPSLIMGGAGTGKTLIAIRLLDNFDRNNSNSFAVYFTQSHELRKKAEKQFNAIKTNIVSSNSIEFENINDFCLDQLELNRTNFVQTSEFLNFFSRHPEYKSVCEKLEITDTAIWTEIRGLIKGSMGQNTKWSRNASVPQEKYHKTIKALELQGYILRDTNNKKRITLSDTIESIKAKSAHDTYLNKNEREDLNELIKYFSSFDYNIRGISKEEYLTASPEFSVLNLEQRKAVYDIYIQYDQYLLDNGLYDENDLIRYMFEKFHDNLPLYDLTVVDEVQDYTELQIYLIYKMSANAKSTIYAGDIHQIINPTMFDIGRLKSLYYNSADENDLKTYFLHNNYRCQQGIVDLANKVSDLRRKSIGKKSEDIEQIERSINNNAISLPKRLSYSRENIIALIDEVMKYPQVAVLVPEEDDRKQLINLIGQEKYDNYDIPFIYTISEIKGMEYQYIICYNVISKYRHIWQRIFASQKSKETLYRFCFNALYVAVTRAQLHLCFVDEYSENHIDDAFGLPNILAFNADELYLNTLSNSVEIWYEQANILKANGDYARALKYYAMSGSFVNQKDIYECKAEVAEKEKNFEEAIKYNLLLGDIERAVKNSKEANVSKEVLEVVYALSGNYKYFANLSKLISIVYKSFEEEDRINIYKMAIDKAFLILKQKIEAIKFPEV